MNIPSGASPKASPGGVGRFFRAVWDAVIFLSVLALTAIALIAIALAAPLALAISALAGMVLPAQKRNRWREAGAA